MTISVLSATLSLPNSLGGAGGGVPGALVASESPATAAGGLGVCAACEDAGAACGGATPGAAAGTTFFS